ncbi:MAG: hypothetical protein OXG15_06630 [Gammaproteobacteria bacterium]|nr:hypothetical protein [Gammaproteobacteria bacterium]
MKKYLLYLVAVILFSPMAADPGHDASCAKGIVLFQKAWRESHDFSWLPLGGLRSYEDACNNDTDYRLYYSQMRATLESKVGNHADALRFNDWRGNSYYKTDELPPSVRATPATPYIVERSLQHRFVVVNERHHVGSDRLLTLELLEPLFEQGFRYLAVETQAHWDDINERGYPVASGGYYSNEVVFAQMLRTALQFGYEIVPYEIEDSQRASENPDEPINRQVERELAQAKNIIARTVSKDSEAKVLVHCGYGHVRETKASNWTTMAYFLKELSSRDPLTIDQVRLSERGSLTEEHPIRQEALKRGLIGGSPVVLLDSTDERVDVSASTDIEVFGVQTSYEHGRPSWMRMGGLREPVWFDTPKCVDQTCILEAMDPSEGEHAVPYDRVEAKHAERIALFLPSNSQSNVRILDLDTEILTERPVSVGVPSVHE